MRIFALSLFLLCSLGVTAVAKADDFTLLGIGTTITFSLPSTLTPDVSSTDVGFLVNDVSVNVDGNTFVTAVGFGAGGPAQYPNLFIGDSAMVTDTTITLGDPNFGYYFGPQLYTGSEFSPTFVPGFYPAANFLDDNAPFLIEVSPSAPDVPEPASLLLLGTGCVAAFTAGRRRIGLSERV